MKKLLPIFLAALLVFCACGKNEPAAAVTPAVPQAVSEVPEPVLAPHESAPIEESEPAAPSYVRALAADVAARAGLYELSGEAAIRGAYKYLVRNVYFANPVELGIWRYFSDEESIPYLENRALSPLLFGIGSCEDFAAAMVLLLRAAGFESEYVAGYTLSVDQVYVDHAWAVVKLDGLWYHIDPQLEQNVIRENRMRYRYYLKSDADMEADHKWGENLIAYWSDMPDKEKGNIRENYTPPPCPENYPAQEAEMAAKPLKPNMADVEQKARELISQSGKGPLPPAHLNVEPPVLVAARHITPPLITTPEDVPDS